MNKFFSTPPPSIEGINIINFFAFVEFNYNLNSNFVIIKDINKNFYAKRTFNFYTNDKLQ